MEAGSGVTDWPSFPFFAARGPDFQTQGSLLGCRHKEGEDGLPFVEIVAVDLELR